MEKKLLRVSEAAIAMNVSRSFLYAMVMRGEIRSIKIGRARRIPVTVLEEWIARQLEEADSGEAPNA